MKADPKTGLLICNVCNHEWSGHGLGGNCLQSPYKPQNEEGPYHA